MKKLVLLLFFGAMVALCSFQSQPIKTLTYTKEFGFKTYELKYQLADTVQEFKAEYIYFYLWIKGTKTLVATSMNGSIVASDEKYIKLIKSKSLW